MEVGETSNGKEWKGVLAARTGRAYSGIEYTRKTTTGLGVTLMYINL